MAGYTIGFANISEEHAYAQLVRQGIESAAVAYPQIKLIVRDNNFDSNQALQNAKEFAALPVDLAIIYHIDERFNPELSRVLRQSLIPIIAVDIPVPLSVFFGVDNRQAGKLAGQVGGTWVQEHWGGRVDKVLVLTDSRVLENVRQRLIGGVEELAAYVQINPDDVLYLDGQNSFEVSQTYSHTVLENWADHEHIVILGLNDETTLGAIEAARQAGRAAHVVGIGQGANFDQFADQAALTRLLGSIGYYPEAYGEHLMDLALRMLAGQKVPTQNFIEHEFIPNPFFTP